LLDEGHYEAVCDAAGALARALERWIEMGGEPWAPWTEIRDLLAAVGATERQMTKDSGGRPKEEWHHVAGVFAAWLDKALSDCGCDPVEAIRARNRIGSAMIEWAYTEARADNSERRSLQLTPAAFADGIRRHPTTDDRAAFEKEFGIRPMNIHHID
jgi:hypothetical protein